MTFLVVIGLAWRHRRPVDPSSAASSTADIWTAGATVLLAVIALVTVVYAGKQIAEAAALRRAEYRAYVAVYADISVAKGRGWLVVENTGRTAAEDISITFDPPLVSPFDKKALRPIGGLAVWRNIPNLPPGRAIRTLWGSNLELSKAVEAGTIPSRFEVTIKYRSPAVQGEFVERTSIDLDIYWGLIDTRVKDTGDVVAKLDEIREALEKGPGGRP